MKNIRINPVILLGGSGSRLWPFSSKRIPKQFRRQLNQKKLTLFQEALLRVNNEEYFHSPIVITSTLYKDIALDQAEEISIKVKLVLEPLPMNTAPACIVASMISMLENNDHVAILSADQHFEDKDFMNSISKKIDFNQNSLYLLGKIPTEPNTNYGYITISEDAGKVKNFSQHKVVKFIEKPNLSIAKSLLSDGNNLWNLGTFIFSPQILLNSIDPDIIKIAQKSIKGYDPSSDSFLLSKEPFSQLPKQSIDLLWVESYSDIQTIVIECDWYDLGSFQSMLNSTYNSDKNGNFSLSPSILNDTKNSLFISKKKIVSNTVSDLLVCESDDAIYISDIKEADKIKDIQEDNEDFFDISGPVSMGKFFRPWGWYKTISFGVGYQVKIINVKPMQKLSLQKHFHREEHWVVLSGQATVILGEESIELSKDESIFINKETKHSLQNLTTKPLEIIELQIGDYLGEDDIVRYSDIYGRV